MHKRKLHHLLKLLRKFSIWYFVIAIVLTGIMAILALRQNNMTAVELREEVLQVDQQNGDVESALRKLREHTYSHMNSSLATENGAYPPIQLKYRYERLIVEQKAQQPTNANLATEAQKYCEGQIPSGRSLNRIDCIQNYMLTHGAGSTPNIPDSLYKFDFAAPVWSPDLAGWSLVLLALLIILFVMRLIAVGWLRHSLRAY